MTTSSGCDAIGRYLGVSNGYFLYNTSPNWVYCYCLECWQKEILALPFVTAKITPDIAALNTTITQLTADKSSLEQQIITLKSENEKEKKRVRIL